MHQKEPLLMKNFTEDPDVAITSLAVSQATALEFNDRKIVEANIILKLCKSRPYQTMTALIGVRIFIAWYCEQIEKKQI